MEYRIIDFLFKADGEREMNELAADGWRFLHMTDTSGRAYVVMERAIDPPAADIVDVGMTVQH